MAQKSWPWSTVAGLGDGAAQLSEASSREFLAVYFGVHDPAVEGVSKGVGGELAVTGVASPLNVASGSGIAYGLYINDAATTTPAIGTPAVGTTGGRVVLQTNWGGTGGAGLEARTRIAVKKSADGNAAIPALTQAFGTTWEVGLATFTITTGGVITVTDGRTFRKSTMQVGDAELRQSAGVSVIGRSANSTGLVADIAAGADDRVLARTGGALSWVQITLGMIAANLITFAKLSQIAGLSVLGRSANTLGDMAAITGTDGQALRVSGTTLGFGTLVAAAYAALSVGTAALADLGVTTGKIALNAITNALIRDSGALSVIGRSANSSGDPADIAAVAASGAVLRESGSTIGFGTVATAGLANDAVDDTKAGNRVPQFYRRQGGAGTAWNVSGTTTTIPTSVRMQAGTKLSDGTGVLAVVFPTAFSDIPLVFTTGYDTGVNPVEATVYLVSATGFTCATYEGGVVAASKQINWLAIGPE